MGGPPSSYNKSNSSWLNEPQADETTNDASSSSTAHGTDPRASTDYASTAHGTDPRASTDYGAKAHTSVPFSSFQVFFLLLYVFRDIV